MKNRKASIFFLFLISLLMLSACQTKTSKPSLSENEAVKEKSKEILSEGIDSREFIENVDWISDSEILSIKKNDLQTSFYLYNLYTGDSKKIFETSSPYVSSSVSPDKEKILIHSAPMTYSAQVTIIDLNGNILYEKEIPSYELTYDWNEYDNNGLLVTSFAEDWSFDVFQIDVNSQSIHPLDVEQPFLQWQSKVSVLYQDWEADEISVTAPLISKNILDNEKELVVDSSIHFHQFKNSLLSVTPSVDDEAFTYQFISENGTIQSEYKVHLLSRYSDWLIPYYDMMLENDRLITFEANETGSFDTYDGTFSLKGWDILTGNEEIIFESLPLEPIKCSPGGAYCLYGNQLEKVIDLKQKKTIQLLTTGEGDGINGDS